VATAIVACGICKDELEAALRRLGGSAPVYYLPGAPCAEPAAFERRLERALRRATAVADDVVVVIGECHPGIDAVVARFGARRSTMTNCFDVLLEGRSKELCREVNTFFTTPAWLRQWPTLRRTLGWGEVDVRQNFGVYERVLMLDAGLTPYTESDVLGFFDDTNVVIDILPITLGGLVGLLQRELTVIPGAKRQKELTDVVA